MKEADEDVLIFTADQKTLPGHHRHTIPSALLLLVCNPVALGHAQMNVNHATSIIKAVGGMNEILDMN